MHTSTLGYIQYASRFTASQRLLTLHHFTTLFSHVAIFKGPSNGLRKAKALKHRWTIYFWASNVKPSHMKTA